MVCLARIVPAMTSELRHELDFWVAAAAAADAAAAAACNCVYIEKEERKQNMAEKMKSARDKSKELYALEYGKSMYVYKYVRMKPGTFKEAAI